MSDAVVVATPPIEVASLTCVANSAPDTTLTDATTALSRIAVVMLEASVAVAIAVADSCADDDVRVAVTTVEVAATFALNKTPVVTDAVVVLVAVRVTLNLTPVVRLAVTVDVLLAAPASSMAPPLAAVSNASQVTLA